MEEMNNDTRAFIPLPLQELDDDKKLSNNDDTAFKM